MVYLLDESVGTITEALSKSNLLQNSIIVFTTDNGAPERGFNSGYPLRGDKGSLFEGGIRGTSFIWSPLLEKRERVSNDLIGMVDWLPTLVSAAGGNVDFEGLNGMNHWKEFIIGNPLKRTELLHNINVVSGASSINVGNFKLLRIRTVVDGQPEEDSKPSYGHPIEKITYDFEKLFASKSAKALQELAMMPTADKIS
jgi:arylsulfatase A-like enzyme